ncbi:hypothetical protein C8R43DRAFT_944529 [Mycena crocata]|nr:hypothetical protein C8R43DRAFT_944529 [Mycena crocata]
MAQGSAAMMGKGSACGRRMVAKTGEIMRRSYQIRRYKEHNTRSQEEEFRANWYAVVAENRALLQKYLIYKRSRAPKWHTYSHAGSGPGDLQKGEGYSSIIVRDYLTLAPPPMPTLIVYDDHDDEGYVTDSDPDVPPHLMESEGEMLARMQQPPIGYSHIPMYTEILAADARAPTDYNSDEPDEEGNCPRRRALFEKDPPGGALTLCCRCYCICSVCHPSVQLVERRWVYGLGPELITCKFIRHPLGPCLLDSHPWFIAETSSVTAAVDRKGKGKVPAVGAGDRPWGGNVYANTAYTKEMRAKKAPQAPEVQEAAADGKDWVASWDAAFNNLLKEVRDETVASSASTEPSLWDVKKWDPQHTEGEWAERRGDTPVIEIKRSFMEGDPHEQQWDFLTKMLWDRRSLP